MDVSVCQPLVCFGIFGTRMTSDIVIFSSTPCFASTMTIAAHCCLWTLTIHDFIRPLTFIYRRIYLICFHICQPFVMNIQQSYVFKEITHSFIISIQVNNLLGITYRFVCSFRRQQPRMDFKCECVCVCANF